MQIESIILNIYKYILNPLIEVGFSLALIVFLWGGVMFIWYQQQGNVAKAQALKYHLLWGILGMFIMASVFGILQVIANSVRAGQSLL